MTYLRSFLFIVGLLLSSPVSGQWEQYFAQWEGRPGSMLVDMGVRATAPLDDYPYLVSVGVAYEQCNDQGFPDTTTYQELTDISDKLFGYMDIQTTCRLVGTFTHDCRRLDYYYLKDTVAVRDFLIKFFSTNGEEYEALVNIKYDPEWNHYLNFIYPDLYIREYLMNADVINQLVAQGDDINKPRRIEHWAYFETEADRDRYRLIVLERGFKEETQGREGDQYYYHFSRRDHIEPEYITELTVHLQTEAQQLNGTYDGWESVVKKEKP